MPFFVGRHILHWDLMAAIHIGDGEIFKIPVLYDYGRPSENLISVFRRPFLCFPILPQAAKRVTIRAVLNRQPIIIFQTASIMTHSSTSQLYIGIMSGTSMDGADAVLIRMDGSRWLGAEAHSFLPYSGRLKRLFGRPNRQ